jgi:crotonobetainyl-CoA:carnitine CoA-transferase CaiB-like acyl-CoA transferase
VARELITEFDHPDIGRVRQPNPAARFDRTPAAIQGPAPRIGEHSAIILAELGIDAVEIPRLVSRSAHPSSLARRLSERPRGQIVGGQISRA